MVLRIRKTRSETIRNSHGHDRGRRKFCCRPHRYSWSFLSNSRTSADLHFLIFCQDEVESLTAARAGAMAGTEPSDALRVGSLSVTHNLTLIFMRIGRECSTHPTRQAQA